jgi:CBS domain-containing protein
MMTIAKPLLALTAGDVMTSPVVVIRLGTRLHTAAHRLRQAAVSAAPVVDEEGRCVGALSAADFVRWAEDNGPPRADASRALTCLYQKDDRRADGTEGTRCTRAGGSCPLQVEDVNLAGEACLFCLLPHCILLDWQQVVEGDPADEVGRYMTRDVVTVTPHTPLTRVARLMIDAHLHRVVVVDDAGRPTGIVTTTDVVAAVAAQARWP